MDKESIEIKQIGEKLAKINIDNNLELKAVVDDLKKIAGTIKVKKVIKELTKTADSIKEFVSNEEDVTKMSDVEIVLRSIASVLYNIATSAVISPDAIVQMCGVCSSIEQAYGVKDKVLTK